MTIVSVFLGRKLMLVSREYKRKVRENDDTLYGTYQAMLSGRNELKLSYERRSSFIEISWSPQLSIPEC